MDANECKTIDNLTVDLKRDPLSVMYASSSTTHYCLTHWRYFVGEYTVGPVPSPLMIIHLGGKPSVRFKVGKGEWSKGYSVPGDLTMAPANRSTNVTVTWQVNGEAETLIFCLAGPSEASEKNTVFASSSLFGTDIQLGVDSPFIRELLQQLWRSFENQMDDDAEAYRTKLLDLFEIHLTQVDRTPQIQTMPPSGIKSANFAQLQNVLHFISEHYSEDLSVKDLATVADMKPSYFAQVFRAQMGVSPHKYLIAKRVESARRLLESTNLSAQRVAAETGFGSQSHFTTTFSKAMGMTPAQYRGRFSSPEGASHS